MGYQIYYAASSQANWYVVQITNEPEFDYVMLVKYRRIDSFVLLSTELPLGLAHYIWQQTTEHDERQGCHLSDVKLGKNKWFFSPRNDEAVIARLKKAVNKLLATAGQQVVFQPTAMENSTLKYPLTDNPYLVNPSDKSPAKGKCYQFLERWEAHPAMGTKVEMLAGRLLLRSELVKILSINNVDLVATSGISEVASETLLSWWLRWLVLQGKAVLLPTLGYNQEHVLTCFRCGNQRKIIKISCYQCGECYQCEECLNMGKATYCGQLFAFPEQEKPGQPVGRATEISARKEWSLSAPQAKAASQLLEFLRDKISEALVWAVCGAGKTEVCFDVIAKVLHQGGRVLFAIPRRDVVIELEQRFRHAFPEVSLVALYGGSNQTYEKGQLVLATTHQVLRFYQAFDLVILDEVDAFPFRGSEMLMYALGRAVKSSGKMIYLTATPSQTLLKSAEGGNIKLIRISARHHGHPLPEPEILIEKSLQPDLCRGLPKVVLESLHRSIEGCGAQIFVFVPTIELAERLGVYLRTMFTQWFGEAPLGMEWVEVSHSKDPLREKKRSDFSDGKFPVLVTTTIMERGVTVPKTEVLVLFSDYRNIFDTGTLIQMAGRAGRTHQWPNGRVWFVASTRTEAMREAVAQIKDINKDARLHGFLYAEGKC